MPQAFRSSARQPDASAPLEDLLSRGHFRAAAIAAVQELTGSGPSGQAVDPRDSARIFHLLYVRLVCLTLVDATSLAAQEVKALEDLNSTRTYVDERTGEHLVPWELRVLNVRLQALGFGDSRRAVMSYHELAREARDRISKAAAARDDDDDDAEHSPASKELWKTRLQDLGIKVAGALVEMNDVSGAAHHLATLKSRDGADGKLALAKSLMWLRLGDVDAARACAAECAEDDVAADKIIFALCDMGDREYEAALEKWTALREDMEDDEMVGVNAAVCLIYLGRLQEVLLLLLISPCFPP